MQCACVPRNAYLVLSDQASDFVPEHFFVRLRGFCCAILHSNSRRVGPNFLAQSPLQDRWEIARSCRPLQRTGHSAGLLEGASVRDNEGQSCAFATAVLFTLDAHPS